MPRGYKPAIFVSSTCYDLSQIRIDLKHFLEGLGLDPLLSEHNSFPVNPNYNTVANCIDVVKNNADILVLVVGGRYGFQTESGKSITNLEYIAAKAKGIPIYIFVSESIINILPIWEKNKEADYSNVVDTTKLLDFVVRLRSESDNWVFPFKRVQDIMEILKNQLAYLFMDALECRTRLHGKSLDEGEFHELSPKSLEIVYFKPSGWEYLLFAQVLKDKVESYRKERLNLRYGVTYGRAVGITRLDELTTWLINHISEAANATESLGRLINEGLPVALGEPGEAGDEKHIAYLATRIGEGYKKLIDWTLEFKNVRTEGQFQRLLELGSHMCENAIAEIEEFTSRIHEEIIEAVSQSTACTEPRTLKLTLVLTIPDLTEFSDEMERLKTECLSLN